MLSIMDWVMIGHRLLYRARALKAGHTKTGRSDVNFEGIWPLRGGPWAFPWTPILRFKTRVASSWLGIARTEPRNPLDSKMAQDGTCRWLGLLWLGLGVAQPYSETSGEHFKKKSLVSLMVSLPTGFLPYASSSLRIAERPTSHHEQQQQQHHHQQHHSSSRMHRACCYMWSMSLSIQPPEI